MIETLHLPKNTVCFRWCISNLVSHLSDGLWHRWRVPNHAVAATHRECGVGATQRSMCTRLEGVDLGPAVMCRGLCPGSRRFLLLSNPAELPDHGVVLVVPGTSGLCYNRQQQCGVSQRTAVTAVSYW